MRPLSYPEVLSVSGGMERKAEILLDSMSCYSFASTLAGGLASGIYGIYTNQNVMTTVGSTIEIGNSWVSTLAYGAAFSWMVGAVIGLGVAFYVAEQEGVLG